MMKFSVSGVFNLGIWIIGGVLLFQPLSARAAGQVFWDWPAGRQFSEMELQGVALNEGGALVPGLQAGQTGPMGPEVCWRVVPDLRGGFYTGTGHGGDIYHTDKGGNTVLFATLAGAEVFSLVLLSDGDLLAGCGPDGHLYRVSEDGETSELGKVPGGYIWGMAVAQDRDTVWLACGSPAAVYSYNVGDGLKELITFPAENTLDLMLDSDGTLLAATQGPGLVYRVDTNNPESAWLICETRQDEVRQFIRGEDGAIFFLALNSEESGVSGAEKAASKTSSMPPSMLSFFGEPLVPEVDKAALFRLQDGNQYKTWWSGNLDLMIVAWSEHWGWLGGGPLSSVGGQSVIHALLPPAGNHPLAGWSGGDILDLNVLNPEDGGQVLLVGQAHPGGVQRLAAKGEGDMTAISPTLDAGGIVRWGRLSWSATVGTGKTKWSVRGGNRSVPDKSWTPWSDSWNSNDHELNLPHCRFLQWRVKMPRRQSEAAAQWAVNSVSVSAWHQNEQPVIRNFTIENLSDISRGGLIGSMDNVTQEFASGLRVEFGRKSQVNKKAGPARAAYTRAVRVMTWQGSDPNSDQLVYRLEYRSLGGQNWRTIIDETVEQMGSWDTQDVPDGQYELRLTASDHPDNPFDQALLSQKRAGPLKVDNTAPVVSGFRVQKVENGLKLVFKAEDSASKLGQALLHLPDGKVQRIDPVDQICDSLKEEFDTKITWPIKGRNSGDKPYQLRIEVWDLSGNVTVTEGEVR